MSLVWKGAPPPGPAPDGMVWNGSEFVQRKAKKKSGASPEQRKAQQAARAKQIAERDAKAAAEAEARRLADPVNQLKPIPSRSSRIAQMRLPSRRFVVPAAVTTTGVLAYGAGRKRRKEPVGKEDSKAKRAAQVAAGGAAGGALAQGAYMGAGFGATQAVERYQKRKFSDVHRKAVQRHREALGISGNHKGFVDTPTPIKERYFREYPLTVPGGGARRLLNRTHGAKTLGRLALPVTAVGATGGAGYMAGKTKKRPNKDRVRSVGKAYDPYPYLPEVDLGIPPQRRQPVSPLNMYAGSRLMVDAQGGFGRRLDRKRKKKAYEGAYSTFQGLGMVYSPVGYGMRTM